MTPDFKILANDNDITNVIRENFISLTLTDKRGLKSDEITLVLNDIDQPINWPKKGAELKVSLGYVGSTLVDKGLYKVDSVKHSGPPDQLIIVAKAADMLGSFKSQITQSYHQKSIKQIIEIIASRNNLKPAVSDKLGRIVIDHIDQAEESDLHFLTKLARRYDALTKPSNGTLLFTEKGKAKTASGANMPRFTLLLNEVSHYSLDEQSRDDYTGVKTYYHDQGSAKRKSVVVGSKDKLKTLKPSYANKTEASSKAQAELDVIKRGGFKGTLDFKHGKPELTAESLIKPTGKGWRAEYVKEWVLDNVIHTLDSSQGLSTQVGFESLNETLL